MEGRIIRIEKTLSSLETSVKDIRYDIQRVRDQKAELPTWVRNAVVTIFIAVFAQSMASVWWASKITTTQQTLVSKVQENAEDRAKSMNTYHEIIIELNKLTVTLNLLTTQNNELHDALKDR